MSNFEFLGVHSKALATLGATAEKIFPLDPTSCVFKLRLLAEAITKDVAARLGIQLQQPSQLNLLRAVDNQLGLDPQVRPSVVNSSRKTRTTNPPPNSCAACANPAPPKTKPKPSAGQNSKRQKPTQLYVVKK